MRYAKVSRLTIDMQGEATMPKDSEESKKAFRELVRILERAVKAGADCLEIETEGQDVVAYQYSGGTGIGAEAIPNDIKDAVLKEISHRANLRHKPTGSILITLAGEEYELFVKEDDRFGGLTLRMNRTRKRSK
jgi:hypothetical protein